MRWYLGECLGVSWRLFFSLDFELSRRMLLVHGLCCELTGLWSNPIARRCVIRSSVSDWSMVISGS